jgi:hypothetical protein
LTEIPSSKKGPRLTIQRRQLYSIPSSLRKQKTQMRSSLLSSTEKITRQWIFSFPSTNSTHTCGLARKNCEEESETRQASERASALLSLSSQGVSNYKFKNLLKRQQLQLISTSKLLPTAINTLRFFARAHAILCNSRRSKLISRVQVGVECCEIVCARYCAQQIRSARATSN